MCVQHAILCLTRNRQQNCVKSATRRGARQREVYMRYSQARRELRWTVFVWLTLDYLWGLLHLIVCDVAVYKCWYASLPPVRRRRLTLLLPSFRIRHIA